MFDHFFKYTKGWSGSKLSPDSEWHQRPRWVVQKPWTLLGERRYGADLSLPKWLHRGYCQFAPRLNILPPKNYEECANSKFENYWVAPLPFIVGGLETRAVILLEPCANLSEGSKEGAYFLLNVFHCQAAKILKNVFTYFWAPYCGFESWVCLTAPIR